MSKTRVNRKIPSVGELIIAHSHARVIAADGKIRLIGIDEVNGMPQFTRMLEDKDAIAQMLRRYAR